MQSVCSSAQSGTGTPQRQLSTGSTQPTISNQSQAQKFVIVKPGINIQQQVKPNIVVMNPPGTNTQVIFQKNILYFCSYLAVQLFAFINQNKCLFQTLTTKYVGNEAQSPSSYVIQESTELDDLSHLE